MTETSIYHRTEAEIESEAKVIDESKKDPQKFEPLYNKYFESIYRFVAQRLIDESTADEITAQVFYKALLNIKKYKHQGVPFSAWLYRIATNELNTFFRKNAKQRTVNIDSENLGGLLQDVKTADKEHLFVAMEEAIQTLDPPDLMLLEMRYFENRAFKEIGVILGITENNAKVKLYRILDKIKKKLKA